jgi:hypothetical protein
MTFEEVEAEFASKVGGMDAFDWFHDFNVGLFTSDLDAYIRRMQALSVPYLTAKWNATAAGAEWYSVFLLFPNSQLVIELMGSSSAILSSAGTAVVLEPRMSDARVKQVSAAPPAGMLLSAVQVTRAASNLTKIHDFYVNGVGASVSQDVATPTVARRCYQWPGAPKADVCFVTRDDASTKGAFKPRDFEKMLFSAHKAILTNPNCAMDRWLDNHYAVDGWFVDGDPLMNYVKASLTTDDPVYYTCGNGVGGAGAHYVTDPTGWAVQLDISMTVILPGCGYSPGRLGDMPWCSAGTCS